MVVEVIIEDTRWADLDIVLLADKSAQATLSYLDMATGAWEISILACDDERIAKLNSDFRGKTKPTNVLSWPSEDRSAEIEGKAPETPEQEFELGDIAISYDTCQKEANAARIPLQNHCLHLLVHGVLHLLGYDHIRERDGDLMERTEIAILDVLGVPNPYSGNGAMGPMDIGKD